MAYPKQEVDKSFKFNDEDEEGNEQLIQSQVIAKFRENLENAVKFFQLYYEQLNMWVVKNKEEKLQQNRLIDQFGDYIEDLTETTSRENQNISYKEPYEEQNSHQYEHIMNQDCYFILYENNQFKQSEFSLEKNNIIEFIQVPWREIMIFLEEQRPNPIKGPTNKFEDICQMIQQFIDRYILKKPSQYAEVKKTKSYLGYVNELVKFFQSRLFSLPFLYKSAPDFNKDLSFQSINQQQQQQAADQNSMNDNNYNNSSYFFRLYFKENEEEDEQLYYSLNALENFFHCFIRSHLILAFFHIQLITKISQDVILKISNKEQEDLDLNEQIRISSLYRIIQHAKSFLELDSLDEQCQYIDFKNIQNFLSNYKESFKYLEKTSEIFELFSKYFFSKDSTLTQQKQMLSQHHTNSLLAYAITNKYFIQMFNKCEESKKINFKENIQSIIKQAFSNELVIKGNKSSDQCFSNCINLVNQIFYYNYFTRQDSLMTQFNETDEGGFLSELDKSFSNTFNQELQYIENNMPTKEELTIILYQSQNQKKKFGVGGSVITKEQRFKERMEFNTKKLKMLLLMMLNMRFYKEDNISESIQKYYSTLYNTKYNFKYDLSIIELFQDKY